MSDRSTAISSRKWSRTSGFGKKLNFQPEGAEAGYLSDGLVGGSLH